MHRREEKRQVMEETEDCESKLRVMPKPKWGLLGEHRGFLCKTYRKGGVWKNREWGTEIGACSTGGQQMLLQARPSQSGASTKGLPSWLPEGSKKREKRRRNSEGMGLVLLWELMLWEQLAADSGCFF